MRLQYKEVRFKKGEVAPNEIFLYVPCLVCNTMPSKLKMVKDAEGKHGPVDGIRIHCPKCGRHASINQWNSVNIED